MRFVTTAIGEQFDYETIEMLIECFHENGESGPHSTEGWGLTHILNHCIVTAVPFTLVFLPAKGYYIKKGALDGVIPEEMRPSFEHMP